MIITELALLPPGTDPVTTGLELAPMLPLYELSIVVAAPFERRSSYRADGATVTRDDG